MGRRAQRPKRFAGEEVPVLPVELEQTLTALIGDEVHALREALQSPSPISIRTNPAKPSLVSGEPIPWCTTGHWLSERPAFTFDPLLHAGAYYVQEASSMFLEQALRASGVIDRDILALDLCAAPGGKSTHLRSLLTPGSLLVANEVVQERRHILAENCWKHGAGDVVITGSDPNDLVELHSFFDLIVVDAPCSGEGMFRKDPFARTQWSPELVLRCAATQTHILDRAWDALAPGGVLIYSTCTWEPSENEEQVQNLIERGAVPINIPMDLVWGFVSNADSGVAGYRSYPHHVRGEGFFIAVLQKPGHSAERTIRSFDRTQGTDLGWTVEKDDLLLIEHREVIHAFGKKWEAVIEAMMVALKVSAPGTPMAERKGSEWQPHPAFAFSTKLDRVAFPEVPLDDATALSYLRGEALPASGAKGVALATYKGHALGWLNGAGSRWNNRYPAPWRIKGQHPKAPRVSWADPV